MLNAKRMLDVGKLACRYFLKLVDKLTSCLKMSLNLGFVIHN